jgi:hypothetical protein
MPLPKALVIALLAMWPLASGAASTATVAGLNFEPPRIVVSERPTRLLLVDGPPARASIPGTGLEFVVNTDWSVFYSRDSKEWYVLDGHHWLRNSMLASGDWIPTTVLPDDFLTLQVSSDWPRVAAALPPRQAQARPQPILISYEPTELVLIDGDIRLASIPGMGLAYVANTRSDLFLLEDRYFLLLSGRWFETRDLKRRWQAVKELPETFGRIPEDHARAHVLTSVPGTEAARQAMIEATTPRVRVLDAASGGELAVPYAGEPRFVPIEGTVLRRAENTPFQVIAHNNFYYLCHEGAWYASSRPGGPWRVATAVPEAIYTIPPTDPAYNVTFVRLDAFDDSSQEVAYSRTSGYYNRYWTGTALVYGTGWHNPGFHDRAVYWRYPHTYGYQGTYWGPGWPAGYPHARSFEAVVPDPDWEWDLDGSKRRVYQYGPRNYLGSGEYILYDGTRYPDDIGTGDDP